MTLYKFGLENIQGPFLYCREVHMLLSAMFSKMANA